MPLILDAYNVLHVVGVLPPHLAGLDVDELAELIARSRYRGERAWLVCDGQPRATGPTIHRGRVAIQYAGTAVDADSRIEQMIDASTSPRRLTVVSSDHRVRRAARRRQCQWLPAEEFLAHLAADARHQARSPGPARPAVPLAGSDVDRWIREFGLAEELLDLPAASPIPPQPRPDASPAPGPSPPTSPGSGRPLEHIERLDQLRLDDLDHFDMGPWLEDGAGPPPDRNQ